MGKDDLSERILLARGYVDAATESFASRSGKRFYHLNTDTDVEAITKIIQKAYDENAVLILSEPNVAQAQVIETLLNNKVGDCLHPGFFVIGTCNVGKTFKGRKAYSPAFENRFQMVNIPYYSKEDLQDIVEEISGVSPNKKEMAKELVVHHVSLTEQLAGNGSAFVPTFREFRARAFEEPARDEYPFYDRILGQLPKIAKPKQTQIPEIFHELSLLANMLICSENRPLNCMLIDRDIPDGIIYEPKSNTIYFSSVVPLEIQKEALYKLVYCLHISPADLETVVSLEDQPLFETFEQLRIARFLMRSPAQFSQEIQKIIDSYGMFIEELKTNINGLIKTSEPEDFFMNLIISYGFGLITEIDIQKISRQIQENQDAVAAVKVNIWVMCELFLNHALPHINFIQHISEDEQLLSKQLLSQTHILALVKCFHDINTQKERAKNVLIEAVEKGLKKEQEKRFEAIKFEKEKAREGKIQSAKLELERKEIKELERIKKFEIEIKRQQTAELEAGRLLLEEVKQKRLAAERTYLESVQMHAQEKRSRQSGLELQANPLADFREQEDFVHTYYSKPVKHKASFPKNPLFLCLAAVACFPCLLCRGCKSKSAKVEPFSDSSPKILPPEPEPSTASTSTPTVTTIPSTAPGSTLSPNTEAPCYPSYGYYGSSSSYSSYGGYYGSPISTAVEPIQPNPYASYYYTAPALNPYATTEEPVQPLPPPLSGHSYYYAASASNPYTTAESVQPSSSSRIRRHAQRSPFLSSAPESSKASTSGPSNLNSVPKKSLPDSSASSESATIILLPKKVIPLVITKIVSGLQSVNSSVELLGTYTPPEQKLMIIDHYAALDTLAKPSQTIAPEVHFDPVPKNPAIAQISLTAQNLEIAADGSYCFSLAIPNKTQIANLQFHPLLTGKIKLPIISNLIQLQLTKQEAEQLFSQTPSAILVTYDFYPLDQEKLAVTSTSLAPFTAKLPFQLNTSVWPELNDQLKLIKKLKPVDACADLAYFLREKAIYSLTEETKKLYPETCNPAQTFLKEHKGCCFEAAIAFLALIKTIFPKIPCRFVDVYFIDHGQINKRSEHALVEVFLEPYGWVSFDPTPIKADKETEAMPYYQKSLISSTAPVSYQKTAVVQISLKEEAIVEAQTKSEIILAMPIPLATCYEFYSNDEALNTKKRLTNASVYTQFFDEVVTSSESEENSSSGKFNIHRAISGHTKIFDKSASSVHVEKKQIILQLTPEALEGEAENLLPFLQLLLDDGFTFFVFSEKNQQLVLCQNVDQIRYWVKIDCCLKPLSYAGNSRICIFDIALAQEIRATILYPVQEKVSLTIDEQHHGMIDLAQFANCEQLEITNPNNFDFELCNAPKSLKEITFVECKTIPKIPESVETVWLEKCDFMGQALNLTLKPDLSSYLHAQVHICDCKNLKAVQANRAVSIRFCDFQQHDLEVHATDLTILSSVNQGRIISDTPPRKSILEKDSGREWVEATGGGKLSGEIKNGFFYKGILLEANGNRYEGQFKNGSKHGKGILLDSNGNRYEGEFKNGLKQGKAFYKYSGSYWQDFWKKDYAVSYKLIRPLTDS
ncbi:MAG: transglutaminase domain-containing protein [Candidatus Margulisiibacteriota bacterium]